MNLAPRVELNTPEGRVATPDSGALLIPGNRPNTAVLSHNMQGHLKLGAEYAPGSTPFSGHCVQEPLPLGVQYNAEPNAFSHDCLPDSPQLDSRRDPATTSAVQMGPHTPPLREEYDRSRAAAFTDRAELDVMFGILDPLSTPPFGCNLPKLRGPLLGPQGDCSAFASSALITPLPGNAPAATPDTPVAGYMPPKGAFPFDRLDSYSPISCGTTLGYQTDRDDPSWDGWGMIGDFEMVDYNMPNDIGALSEELPPWCE